MSEKFIKHPLEAVSVGDIVDVRVLGVDMKKKRISLSMKGSVNKEIFSKVKRPGMFCNYIADEIQQNYDTVTAAIITYSLQSRRNRFYKEKIIAVILYYRMRTIEFDYIRREEN